MAVHPPRMPNSPLKKARAQRGERAGERPYWPILGSSAKICFRFSFWRVWEAPAWTPPRRLPKAMVMRGPAVTVFWLPILVLSSYRLRIALCKAVDEFTAALFREITTTARQAGHSSLRGRQRYSSLARRTSSSAFSASRLHSSSLLLRRPVSALGPVTTSFEPGHSRISLCSKEGQSLSLVS